MANLYISNGTCFLAAATESNDIFGPCGNDAAGHKACCQLGDQCLSHNACYNGQFGTTYLAGCSDPEYKDAACPDKAGLTDSPWTGLVYCNGTSNQWMACAQSRKPAIIGKPDACYCPQDEADRRIAFEAGDTLDFVAQMPTSRGGSMVFQPGYVPTQAVTIISTVQSGRPTSLTSTIPVATGTSSTPIPAQTSEAVESGGGGGSGSSGLSKGATIGIAVGASVGGLILLATLAFLYFARRHRIRNRPAATDVAEVADTESDKPPESDPSELPDIGLKSNVASVAGQPSPLTPSSRYASLVAAGPGSINTPVSSVAPSELGAQPARPWSVRSELQGSDVRPEPERREPMLPTLVELPG